MKTYVQIKLFADLSAYTPPSADNFPIESGKTVRRLLEDIRIPAEKVRLVFINNVKRVGIFPPIGGG
jgi:molybdopterin converting factor small subunit